MAGSGHETFQQQGAQAFAVVLVGDDDGDVGPLVVDAFVGTGAHDGALHVGEHTAVRRVAGPDEPADLGVRRGAGAEEPQVPVVRRQLLVQRPQGRRVVGPDAPDPHDPAVHGQVVGGVAHRFHPHLAMSVAAAAGGRAEGPLMPGRAACSARFATPMVRTAWRG
ncbi:hypothetical protein GCM10027610_015230 [Dactylosporangium cerinum]